MVHAKNMQILRSFLKEFEFLFLFWAQMKKLIAKKEAT
jgi:hypothetical protein